MQKELTTSCLWKTCRSLWALYKPQMSHSWQIIQTTANRFILKNWYEVKCQHVQFKIKFWNLIFKHWNSRDFCVITYYQVILLSFFINFRMFRVTQLVSLLWFLGSHVLLLVLGFRSLLSLVIIFYSLVTGIPKIGLCQTEFISNWGCKYAKTRPFLFSFFPEKRR